MPQDRSDIPRSRAVWRRSSGYFARSHNALAFTLVELLVVLAVIILLIGLLLPIIGRAQTAANSVRCLSNLRQISLAFHYYANDNQNYLPDPSVANASWEQMIGPYLTPAVFICPSDNVAPTLQSSYDWRDTGILATTLAGARRNDAHIALVFDSLPGWHSMGTLNVGMLDGSAQTMNQKSWQKDMNTPVPGNPN